MDDLIKAAQAQNWRQVILVRRDLNMSPGKLAAQVAHGSMAFLSWMVRDNAVLKNDTKFAAMVAEEGPFHVVKCDPKPYYDVYFTLDANMMWGWLEGAFTKVVLGVKDKPELDKILTKAWKEYGMEEGRDWFAIRDNCLTELEPEEIDENGVGRTLTVVGFKPMPKETIDKVTGRLRLL